MRILIVQNEFAYSGAPLCAFEVGKALAKDGHTVFAVAPSQGELINDYTSNGVKCVVDPSIFQDARASYNLAKQVDAVIVFTSVAYQAVYGAKGAGKPCVYAIHEFNALGVGWARENLIFRRALEIADVVTVTCDFAKDQLASYIDRDKIITAIVGIDPIDTSSFPKKESDKLKVITVGSIEPRKNQAGSVAALAALDGVEYSIIGRPLDVGYYNNIVNKAKEAKNINVLSHVGRNEVLHVINEHDVVLCYSLDETIPRFIMEGLAMGKCVISSDISGIHEVIEHDKTGLLVNQYDGGGLRKIIQELTKDKIKQLGDAAKTSINNKFNLASYTSIYSRLMGK